MSKKEEDSKKVQTFIHKIRLRGIMYTLVIAVNDIIYLDELK